MPCDPGTAWLAMGVAVWFPLLVEGTASRRVVPRVREAATVYVGSGGQPVTGVHVRENRLSVFGKTGLVATWDPAEGASRVSPREAERAGLALEPYQRFVFSETGRGMARLTYVLAPPEEFTVSLEVRSKRGWASIVELHDQYFFFMSDNGDRFVASLRDVHRPSTSDVRIFDRRGEQLGEPFAPGPVRNIRLSANGKTIAVNALGALTLFRANGMPETPALPPAEDCRLSRDGMLLASLHKDHVTVHQKSAGQWELRWTIQTGATPRDAEFDPSGRFLVVVDSIKLYRLDLAAPGGGAVDEIDSLPPGLRSADVDVRGAAVVGSMQVLQPETRTQEGLATAVVTALDPSLGDQDVSDTRDVAEWSWDSPMVRYFGAGRVLIQVRDSVFVE